MSFTVSTRESASANSITLEAARTFTGEQQDAISYVVPDSTTDFEIVMGIDVSKVKMIMILATGGALTIETNDGTTPDDTLSMTDGVPRVWRNGDYNTIFLSADVTSLFVTNASGASVTLKILVVSDL